MKHLKQLSNICNSPKRPPDVEAHGVQPKERRQEQEMHGDR